jgi:hypothetical protein
MLLLAVLIVLIALLALVRWLSAGSFTRDVDHLGAMSDRWLAEHRSSRQP